ncbi:MAG TPA: hypothetical protein VK524_00390 [Polyangiaceae bacterium]|nr:hypothetical protein [Polyangiaceae bacterium]
MKSRVDAQFRTEVRVFDLRYTCESCAHYEPEGKLCGNGYPTEPHRARELLDVRELLFCKQYELG